MYDAAAAFQLEFQHQENGRPEEARINHNRMLGAKTKIFKDQNIQEGQKRKIQHHVFPHLPGEGC